MSDNPDETSYYLRILSMYLDLGTKTVLKVFTYHTPGRDVYTFLTSQKSKLEQLAREKVFNKQEADLLLNPACNTKDFDISILITLSINLFSNGQLSPPVQGWDKAPSKKDKSIGADLLRLRKIRNVIVGHHPKAQMAKWRFDDMWDQIEEILLRIYKSISPHEEEQLKKLISDYKEQPLDPSIQEKYNEKLMLWHKEVSEIQEQVDCLLKRLTGFDMYFKSKSDRYQRYMNLLLKGGKFVLSTFLEEELQRNHLELGSVLNDNEELLRQTVREATYIDILYPKSSSPQFQTESWDISLLATVILQVFEQSLDEEMEQEISNIRTAEKDYAKAAFIALNSDTFAEYSFGLKYSIKFLSRCLSKGKKQECHKILEECMEDSTEGFHLKSYMDSLKSNSENMKNLTDIFRDTLKDTKEYLQQMVTNGIHFKREQVLVLKMLTVGTDEQKCKVAEDILSTVWLEALERTEDTTDFELIRKEVDEILTVVRRGKDVKDITIERVCILLQIVCISPQGMLELIQYFDSEEFHKKISFICEDLGYHFSTVFAVHVPVHLTFDCMNEVLTDHKHSKQEVQSGLSLPFTVSSAEGMKKLKTFFKSDIMTNSINAIADCLSNKLDETITLKTTECMSGLQSLYEEIEESSSSSLSDSVESDENVFHDSISNRTNLSVACVSETHGVRSVDITSTEQNYIHTGSESGKVPATTEGDEGTNNITTMPQTDEECMDLTKGTTHVSQNDSLRRRDGEENQEKSSRTTSSTSDECSQTNPLDEDAETNSKLIELVDHFGTIRLNDKNFGGDILILRPNIQNLHALSLFAITLSEYSLTTLLQSLPNSKLGINLFLGQIKIAHETSDKNYEKVIKIGGFLRNIKLSYIDFDGLILQFSPTSQVIDSVCMENISLTGDSLRSLLESIPQNTRYIDLTLAYVTATRSDDISSRKPISICGKFKKVQITDTNFNNFRIIFHSKSRISDSVYLDYITLTNTAFCTLLKSIPKTRHGIDFALACMQLTPDTETLPDCIASISGTVKNVVLWNTELKNNILNLGIQGQTLELISLTQITMTDESLRCLLESVPDTKHGIDISLVNITITQCGRKTDSITFFNKMKSVQLSNTDYGDQRIELDQSAKILDDIGMFDVTITSESLCSFLKTIPDTDDGIDLVLANLRLQPGSGKAIICGNFWSIQLRNTNFGDMVLMFDPGAQIIRSLSLECISISEESLCRLLRSIPKTEHILDIDLKNVSLISGDTLSVITQLNEPPRLFETILLIDDIERDGKCIQSLTLSVIR